MPVLITILIVLGVIVLGFVVIVALQPADFRITRTTSVTAPPPALFAQVNDFHQWQAWSPWAKLDPACRNTFEGAPAGAGAAFGWSGNKKVGEGRMLITESQPSDLIRIKIDFVKPFAATNIAEFTFKPQGDQTIVKWDMTGQKNFMSKAFCMFVNMDKMVGSEFEKGLADMKTIAEAGPRQ